LRVIEGALTGRLQFGIVLRILPISPGPARADDLGIEPLVRNPNLADQPIVVIDIDPLDPHPLAVDPLADERRCLAMKPLAIFGGVDAMQPDAGLATVAEQHVDRVPVANLHHAGFEHCR